ncbi:hypothetical protein [Acinetobacter sp. ANC 4173]|uniref:hypothetical protein n=1 Tax=Acinetobacter sp. ANC 4173 TaxID=2529837 RepID=UPI00103DA902|nr:hypothetical protein [Acinetobacter sp. ANC 4173]TCB81695.1 hypothetical protein E0H94_04025 [Acinetobacter sp. ANC 4173]
MFCILDGLALATVSKNIIENQGEIVVVSHSILAIVSAVITESHLAYYQAIRLGTENRKVFY